jgi:nucleotide-binding universal stress UspA family protein
MQPMRTILFATDFSPTSEAAFEVARSLAKAQGARLVALHVAPMEIVYGELLRPPTDPRLYLNSLEDRLQQLKPTDLDVAYHAIVREGDAVTEILRAADEVECDLIVIGSHGRTGLSRLVLGSVAEGVMREATCPVLTVKRPALDQATHANSPRSASAPA